MEANETLTPAQIFEYNQAFARSLQMLADVTQHQIDGIVDTAIRICQAIAALGNQPPQPGAGMPADLAADLKASLGQQTAAKLTVPEEEVMPRTRIGNHAAIGQASESNSAGHNIDNIVQALSIARLNAVTAQQQLNIIAQASVTTGISQMLAAVSIMHQVEPGNAEIMQG